jgi:hypothetical protein
MDSTSTGPADVPKDAVAVARHSTTEAPTKNIEETYPNTTEQRTCLRLQIGEIIVQYHTCFYGILYSPRYKLLNCHPGC